MSDNERFEAWYCPKVVRNAWMKMINNSQGAFREAMREAFMAGVKAGRLKAAEEKQEAKHE